MLFVIILEVKIAFDALWFNKTKRRLSISLRYVSQDCIKGIDFLIPSLIKK